jgi:hypothetical protein
MKNFNKLTKAELISQIKGLKENSTFQNKLFNYFYIFKQILIKFTFLALKINLLKDLEFFEDCD